MRNPQFYISKEEPWMDVLSIRFRYQDDHGNYYVAQPVTLTKINPEDCVSGAVPQPMMAMETRHGGAAALQSLMDQLWNIGIRPSDIGTPGHLAATQKHLDDMRAIVGKGLEIKLP